eukprot:1180044-Prorocentrum_minimum.AAC.3
MHHRLGQVRHRIRPHGVDPTQQIRRRGGLVHQAARQHERLDRLIKQTPQTKPQRKKRQEHLAVSSAPPN